MELNALFASHMVLQADRPIRLFGTGSGHLSVSLDGATVEAECGEEWCVCLPAHSHGGPFRMELSLDGEAVIFDDVMVGEVLLAAGQSNMQFKLKESSTPAEAYLGDDRIRLFSLGRIEDTDRFRPGDGWVRLARETAGDWSAIGYHTARFLAEELSCAVGVIACYQGASVIESWLPEEIAEKDCYRLPDESKHHDHFEPCYLPWNSPGTLYHAMFRKLGCFPMAAVLWYQGESNTGSLAEVNTYRGLLRELISRWRSDLRDPALPFLIVQIATFVGRDTEAWREMQQVQREADNPADRVYSVASADVCEQDCIHPKTKDRLSRRLCDTFLTAGLTRGYTPVPSMESKEPPQ